MFYFLVGIYSAQRKMVRYPSFRSVIPGLKQAGQIRDFSDVRPDASVVLLLGSNGLGRGLINAQPKPD